jgi:type I restriction enzyme S subunit
MKKVPIGDLLDLQYGKSLRKDKRVKGTNPVYGSNGIVDYHNDYLVEEPTIIVGRKGSIGEVWLSSSPCWPIDTTYFVVPKKNVSIDINWLYRLLKTLGLSKLNRSAAIPGLNRNDVYRIKIPLPPLEDQKRIASILTRVEKLIARRKESIQLLDELLKSTFLEMFGDPVRNEKGWSFLPLIKFGTISTGNTPPRNKPENYSDGIIEWIKTDNILSDSAIISEATEMLSEVGLKKGRTVKKNALLVACIAGSIESIGRAALSDRSVAFNQQINAIQPYDDVNPFFLYFLFKICRKYIQNHATKGMKKILTKGDFIKIKMIKPPIDLQNQFAIIVEKIESIKSRYQQSLAELENLYGSLSQKAFKGELDLSRIPLPQVDELESKGKKTIQIQAFQAKDEPEQKEKKSMNESELSNKIRKMFKDKLFTAKDLIESLGLAYESTEDDSVFFIDKNGKNLTIKDFLFATINNDSKELLSLEQVFTDDPQNKKQERRVFLKVKS